jgi:hypothetical protein
MCSLRRHKGSNVRYEASRFSADIAFMFCSLRGAWHLARRSAPQVVISALQSGGRQPCVRAGCGTNQKVFNGLILVVHTKMRSRMHERLSFVIAPCVGSGSSERSQRHLMSCPREEFTPYRNVHSSSDAFSAGDHDYTHPLR